MLPYFSSTVYHVFGIPLQTWGTFVAIGYAVGVYLAWRRAKQRGLDEKRVLDLAFWIFVGAFVGARLFHVFFYEPAYFFQHPFEILDPRRPGFAIFGGFLGSALVVWFFVKKYSLDFLAYADALIWGLPWGCGIGRIGCFLIHDHPGTLTHFILGVKYPDGTVRHDLGLYLSLIGFLTGILFLVLNKWKRHPGFWLGMYMMIEGVTRFTLDFLRIADTKYFGLTPTQYLSIPLFAAGLWLVIRKTRRV
ncbi:MAG TPA: prolipoprotein diacylglyceryl transferase [Patescibacteria group bacterium]|nr:prolipoprotein diacylglyceryl transferase [Patescibacteria group bacterium]